MSVTIGTKNYYGSVPANLQTERSALKQSDPEEEKTPASGSKNAAEAEAENVAAIYEKSEPENTFIYSAQQVKAASAADTYGKYQTYLKDLGFYNGAIDGVYGDEFKKALVCFQKAYGSDYKVDKVLDVSSSMPDSLKNWIQKVGAAYYTNYANGKATAAMKALNISSSETEKKQNFARIMTFLEKGIGCTTNQIAGILGNVMQESEFKPAAIRPSSGAFGIFQWTPPRRDYLDDFAANFGYDSDNIGVQLAYFKYEVSSTWGTDCLGGYASNSHLVTGWKELMNEAKTDYNKASDIFYEKIEAPEDGTDVKRRAYAKAIYNAIK